MFGYNKNILIFESFYKPTNINLFNINEKYLIFSGIGNPDGFKETLIKTECNFAMGHGVELECQKLISQSSLICIFGSSLGETDKTWWDLISDKLKDKKTRLIIFDYNPSFSRVLSQRQARMKREILNHFCSVSDLDSIRDSVYYCINSQMFNLFKK